MAEPRMKLRAAATVLAVAATMLTIGAHQATASVTQNGPVNYAGPGPCPAGTSEGAGTCLISSGNVDVVQKAPTGGSNTIDCRGSSCVGTQTGTTSGDKPTNVASCTSAVSFTSSATTSEQLCDIDQTGGSNTLNGDLKATANTGTTASPCTNSVVNLATVTQRARQRFITTQTGDTNSLTVKGNITECAASVLDATSPVNHSQSTAILAQNTMTAAVSNVANFDLTRSQTSNATGATPTQAQDTSAGNDPSIVDGLGKVVLKAVSAGTNALKLAGTDTKDEQATSLDLGQVTQSQGHSGGGWIVDLSGTDSAVAPSDPTVADIDLGKPNGSPGFQKIWTQHAVGLGGGAVPKVQRQDDKLSLPIIGQSPFRLYANGRNSLTNDEGGFEDCNANSVGHVKEWAHGKLGCEDHAGTKTQTPSVTWDGSTWDVNVKCQLNSDSCPGGTTTTIVKHVDVLINGADQKSGVIPVSILTHPDDQNAATVDDASQVDPSTVCFGSASDPSKRDCTLSSKATLGDADSDGDIDLKLHYEAQQTGIKPSDTTACLTGKTYSGESVEGCAPLPKG